MQNKKPVQGIDYIIKVSRRSRSLRLAVYCDGKVVATVPYNFDLGILEKFVLRKAEWIREKVEYFKKQRIIVLPRRNRPDYLNRKHEAMRLIKERLSFFNEIYNFEFKRISVKNQRTKWGSCSSKKNLNFNYKLIFLPSALSDYVIVHELCHLAELNHSARFWALVARAIPDYRMRRKELHRHRL